MCWLEIINNFNWILEIDWNLLQTITGMLISVVAFFLYKKYRKIVLRMLLAFKIKKHECGVSIPTHRCLVLHKEREMIIREEAQPCFELVNLLNTAGITANIIEIDKTSNLDEIHIGGPVSNRHTNRYFCQYFQNIKWVATENHVAKYKEDKNLQTFNYDYLEVSDDFEGFNIDGKLYKYIKNKEGWAFVVRIRISDDGVPKMVHLLFGCGTNGTIGAVNYFLKYYPFIWKNNMRPKDYIGVFKVDKDGNKIGRIEWLDAKRYINK